MQPFQTIETKTTLKTLNIAIHKLKVYNVYCTTNFIITFNLSIDATVFCFRLFLHFPSSTMKKKTTIVHVRTNTNEANQLKRMIFIFEHLHTQTKNCKLQAKTKKSHTHIHTAASTSTF